MFAPLEPSPFNAVKSLAVSMASIPPRQRIRGPRRSRWIFLWLVVAAVVVTIVAGHVWYVWFAPPPHSTSLTPPTLSSVYGIQSGSTDGIGSDSGFPDCASTNCSFYNFTFSKVGRGLPIGELDFGVTAKTGSSVAVTGGVGVENETSGLEVGYFDFQNGTGSPHSILNVSVESDLALSLFGVGPLNLENDDVWATAAPAYSGAVRALST
jgi:hypothetical protein